MPTAWNGEWLIQRFIERWSGAWHWSNPNPVKLPGVTTLATAGAAGAAEAPAEAVAPAVLSPPAIPESSSTRTATVAVTGGRWRPPRGGREERAVRMLGL